MGPGCLACAYRQRDKGSLLNVAKLEVFALGICGLARDQVQPELLSSLERDWSQADCRAERADLVERVGAHVAVADEVRQRHLRAVHEPQDGRGCRVVA
jgi:hypothetical protein